MDRQSRFPRMDRCCACGVKHYAGTPCIGKAGAELGGDEARAFVDRMELLECPDPDCPSDEAPVYEHGVMGVRVSCGCGISGGWEGHLDGAAGEWHRLYRCKATEAERDRLRAALRQQIELLDHLVEWQCAKDEREAGVWPELLIHDPVQYVVNRLRAILPQPGIGPGSL